MSIGHEKLKSIGAQKIHEDTHISRQHVQAVIYESYDDMTKIQFLGFISIIEREYNLDLSELRKNGLEHFNEIIISRDEEDKLFLTSKKKKNFTLVYIVLLFFVFIVVSYFSLNISDSSDTKVDNTSIENATSNIDTIQVMEESNLGVDVNSNIEVNNTFEDKSIAIVKTLVIKPDADVWLGYIDLKTHKKYQTIISDELILDANKTWLLTFGHGYFSININGVKQSYSDKKTVRFLYKDSNMTKINYTEFKKLNKGVGW